MFLLNNNNNRVIGLKIRKNIENKQVYNKIKRILLKLLNYFKKLII